MYPTEIDTIATMPGSSTLSAAGHSTRHNLEIKPIVEALEAKVGVDGSAITTTHDYKLSGVTGTDKAVSKTGTETLTNKTLTSPVITTPVLDIKFRAGWDLLSATGTRTGNNSMTIMGDITSVLWIGKPLEVTDTTTKHFFLTSFSYSAPNTTLGFTAGSDAILVGTPTNIYGGLHSSPVGFTDWFNWVPVTSAGGSMTFTTTQLSKAIFSLKGRVVSYVLNVGGTTGGSASNYLLVTLPIPASSVDYANGCETVDTSAIAGFVFLNSVSQLGCFKYDGSNYGLNTGKVIKSSGSYQI